MKLDNKFGNAEHLSPNWCPCEGSCFTSCGGGCTGCYGCRGFS